MDDRELNEIKWLEWAKELQFLAQNGLTYSKDIFDIERFKRIREISAEIISFKSEIPLDKVKNIFCNETGYQTPKLETRAAVFSQGKILLVQEADGRWALPGGWTDVNQSVKSNTEKEVFEEAGLIVEAEKIIALEDRNKHNKPVYAYGICKVFVLCRYIRGNFVKNPETLSSGYFSVDELPPLAEEKTNREQIKMCFEAEADPNWKVFFD